MSKPDTITVVTKAKKEVDADAADIEVSVVGGSLFSGEEALQKAVEVKHLISQLKEAGIEENRIKLRSVEVDSASFAILRTSSAKYTIKVSRVSIERLPSVLAVIGSQKNCKLNWLEWIYDSAEDVTNKLRTEALEKVIAMARKDAETLGVRILGIYNLNDNNRNDAVSREYVSSETMHSSGSSSIDLGFALGNATHVRVDLKAEFRVSNIHDH